MKVNEIIEQLQPDLNGRLSILLVEDDIESGKAMDAALTLFEVNVQWVASAEEALEVFDTNKFDAVVTDIRLGGASGVDLLREIRSQSDDYPVILLTAYSDVDAAVEAVKLGAQDYIMKPLDGIESLIRPLEKEVRHYRTKQINQKLQEELRLQNKRVKDMSSELLLAEERERRKLSIDLHDSIAQLLTAALLHLDMASVQGKDLMSCIQSAKRNLGEAVDRTRSLTLQLSSSTLYAYGLKAALTDLMEDMAVEYKIKMQLESSEEDIDMSDDCVVLLYRTARELLINIVKHAEAQEAKLVISCDDHEFKIEVSDDGKGFDAEQYASIEKPKAGIGLLSIKDRLDVLGGRFDITSEPGSGVRAVVAVPVARLKEQLGENKGVE